MAGEDWHKDYEGPAVEGTKNVLEAAAKVPCESMILPSPRFIRKLILAISQPSSTSSLPPLSHRSETSTSPPQNRPTRSTPKMTGTPSPTTTARSSRPTTLWPAPSGTAPRRSSPNRLLGMSQRRLRTSFQPSARRVSRSAFATKAIPSDHSASFSGLRSSYPLHLLLGRPQHLVRCCLLAYEGRWFERQGGSGNRLPGFR
jgi:hypothetical protein